MFRDQKGISVEEEFAKNKELKKDDLQHLRDWCSKQPHLPKITDNHLILFLHSNYYRLEPSKTTIENYYTCRTHVVEFFTNRDPIGSKEVRLSMSTLYGSPLNLLYNTFFQYLIIKDISTIKNFDV